MGDLERFVLHEASGHHEIGQIGAVHPPRDVVSGGDRAEGAGVVVEADGVVEAGGLGDLLAEPLHPFRRIEEPPGRAELQARIDAGQRRQLGALTDCDTGEWNGYLEAHRKRRAFFREAGATATDHGHPTADTANLSDSEAAALYTRVASGAASPDDAGLFRAQMLTEMAKMSVEDGMVMQIHAGSWRNHSAAVFASHGRDKGFDIPRRTSYVDALKPMLDAVGMEPNLTVILFTLDETVYSRELAPLAGVYPCLRLGPPWWFFDSVEGMKRFRAATTETAGFYNTVGFNDDTRAFPSIPARHDVARRVDCAYLAELVRSGQLIEEEAADLAQELAYRLARKAYRL